MRTVSVRALERGLAILEYLNKWNGARVTDIMDVVGAPHATTYRLLKTLRDQGLLTKGNDRGEYWLSAGVKSLSAGYKTDGWLTENVLPIIEETAGKLHWPVFLMQQRGTGMVVRGKNLEPCPLIKGEIPTGTASEMTDTAGGLVCLANAEITASAKPSAKVATIRRQGFAVRNESKNHVVQIAVPLHGMDGLWGALMCRYNACACPDRATQDEIVRELAEAARAISPYLVAPPPIVETTKPARRRK